MATTSKQMVSRPRVKTGCATCRKRRIKCDEVRPSCGGCVRSGWKCDGYPIAVPVAKPRSPRQHPVLDITSYSIPFRMPGSQKDRQVLHYFCTQGASDISGFFNSGFWSQTVLRQSHHEPSVRQVLVALSSVHLDYITTDALAGTVASQSTLQQYSKSLRMIRRRLERPSPENTTIALIACIMYYCFESALGNSKAAIAHLDKGLLVFDATRGSISDGDDTKAIADLLSRLDVQATIFNDHRMPILELTSEAERQNGFITSPELPFPSVEVAQKALIKLQNWILRLIISKTHYQDQPLELVPSNVLEEKNHLDSQLSIWNRKSLRSATSTPPSDQREVDCGMKILRVQYGAFHMLLQSNFPHDPTIFTMSPNPTARGIVRLAELVIQHAQSRNSDASTVKNPRRSFSSETGIVAPLVLLIMRCTDVVVIEKGTHLLSLTQRQEGLYDTVAIIAMLQHLNGIGKARAERSYRTGENEQQRSLEYWTRDFIEGAPAGMKNDGKLIPLTILPVAHDGIDSEETKAEGD